MQGLLVQGYNNPRYGNKNLPISQIAPEDVINVFTGVSIYGTGKYAP